MINHAPLTIYDFGCRVPGDFWNHMLSAIPGAVICALLLGALAAIGCLLRRGACFQASDILSGWSVVAAFMTLTAILLPLTLLYTAYVVFGLMLVATVIAVRTRYFLSPFWLLALFVGLPVLIAVNVTGIAKWDDFTHWVPNALYLYQNDGVPSSALPASHSAWPGYPYALPFLTYLASQLAGGFLVQGGAMFNFLFLLTFAGMLVEIYPAAKGSKPISLHRISFLGFALLTVTLANPNFNASFTMTSQGDTSTMVVVAAVGLMLWRLVDALRRDDRTAANAGTFQIALANILLVLIRQSNVAVLGLLVLAFLIVAWKNDVLKGAAKRLPAILLGAIAMRLLWQHYVDAELAGNGFSFHQLSAWRFDLLGPLFEAMGREMLRKSGCFALMLGVIISGVICLFRPATRVRNFILMAAIVYAGYFAFLLLCYIGATFSEGEIRRAASFYRYSTNTGLLGIVAMWIAAPRIRDWLKKRIAFPSFAVPTVPRIAAWLFVPLILPLSLALDAHWLVAHPIPENCGYRVQARQIAEELPSNARLAIFEPETDSMFSCITNFELALKDARSGGQTAVVWNVNMFNSDTLAWRVDELQTNTTIDAVFLQKARQTPIRVLGFDNAHASALLLRRNRDWQLAH